MNIHSKKFASIEMASYVTETSGYTENSSVFFWSKEADESLSDLHYIGNDRCKVL